MAGMLRMPYPQFLAANAAGGIAWSTTIGVVAYKIGDNADKIFGQVSVWALVAIAVVAIAAYAVYKFRRRGKAGAVPTERLNAVLEPLGAVPEPVTAVPTDSQTAESSADA
jgi:MFS superfamily sulfate permease-like transporter